MRGIHFKIFYKKHPFLLWIKNSLHQQVQAKFRFSKIQTIYFKGCSQFLSGFSYIEEIVYHFRLLHIILNNYNLKTQYQNKGEQIKKSLNTRTQNTEFVLSTDCTGQLHWILFFNTTSKATFILVQRHSSIFQLPHISYSKETV